MRNYNKYKLESKGKDAVDDRTSRSRLVMSTVNMP
jgi:hypothetical protein